MQQKTRSDVNVAAAQKKYSRFQTCSMLATAMRQSLVFFFLFYFVKYFSVLIEYFPPLFAGNCSLATLPSQQAQTTCDSLGITLLFNFEISEAGPVHASAWSSLF